MRKLTARHIDNKFSVLELRGDVDPDLINQMREYGTLVAYDGTSSHEERADGHYVQIIVDSNQALHLAMRIRDDLKKREGEVSLSYVVPAPESK